MEKEIIYNGIEFTDEIINDILIPQLPSSYVDFWDIKYNSKNGGIRCSYNTIDSIYLFASIKGKDENILKFNKLPHSDYFEFDSLYVGYDIKGKDIYDDYRYNLDNKLIATYNFIPNEDGGHFCNQFKDDVLLKQYVTNSKLSNPYPLQQMIDKNVITNFDINTTQVDGFHVLGDVNTVYYFIR